jgi:hypothetical protein
VSVVNKVSILIPTRFDSRWNLELCLRSIVKYTQYPYHIIIGDAGIDSEASDFLSHWSEIEIVRCPDPFRPKDCLVKFVQTPYFLFLHDDTQILSKDWLEKRVRIIESDYRIGIVGTIGWNYIYNLHRFFQFSTLRKRFFPLGLLVRKTMQDELDLVWGKIKGFDTGSLAYFQFCLQKKWKFKRCKFNKDIKHWGGMTWPKRRLEKDQNRIADQFMVEHKKKIEMIKEILKAGRY